MDQLPDDVLAMAMSHLSVRDVLACRLVCKRLADLAQHPYVWRTRHVDVGERRRDNNYDSDDSEDDEDDADDNGADGGGDDADDNVDDDGGGREPCVCRVLRLAPCVRQISTPVPVPRSRSCRHGDLRTTSCAARVLSIKMFWYEPEPAVQIIKQQEALGRLRAVSLEFSDTPLTVYAVDSLFGTLASTPGLEMVTLNWRNTCSIPPGTGLSGTITPSLKTFRCETTPQVEPFCDYMLAGHADTLEDVAFSLASPSGPLWAWEAFSPRLTFITSPSTARLLAGMPNLRKLSCPLMPGLGELAACESLRELKLSMGCVTADDANAPGAVELLRRAHQLRSLYLSFSYPGVNNDFGKELISGLTSSGLSPVETLVLEVEGYVLQSNLVPHLGAQLPLMPALRRLVLKVHPDTLLDVITPLSNPALRSLQIVRSRSGATSFKIPCLHELLHRGEFKALLLRNPLLHVEIDCAYCSAHNCSACKQECHEDIFKGKFQFVGVFTHPKDNCSSPEGHDSEYHWIHINDLFTSCYDDDDLSSPGI